MKTSARAGVMRKPPGLRGMTGWKGRVSFALGAATKWGRENKRTNAREGRKKKNEFTMDMVSDT